MTVVITGGKKATGFLAKLKRLFFKKDPVLRVGFMTGDYPDTGLPIAYIAACNEFGGTFTIPAHDQTIYKSVNVKTGKFNKKGRFVKASKSNHQQVVHVDEYTVTIPPRPFFRNMINTGLPHWGKDAEKAMKVAGYNVEHFLELMGSQFTNELKDSIKANIYVKNAPSTIRRKAHKGRNQTLIESSTMWNSVIHRVDV
jgi:hypothetical protein